MKARKRFPEKDRSLKFASAARRFPRSSAPADEAPAPAETESPGQLGRTRHELYNELMAHGLRSVYAFRPMLDRIVDEIPNEELTPERVRAWLEPLRDCIVEWYEAGMASWDIPDSLLADFVRRATNAPWRAAMEGAGFSWDGTRWAKGQEGGVGRDEG